MTKEEYYDAIEEIEVILDNHTGALFVQRRSDKQPLWAHFYPI